MPLCLQAFWIEIGQDKVDKEGRRAMTHDEKSSW